MRRNTRYASTYVRKQVPLSQYNLFDVVRHVFFFTAANALATPNNDELATHPCEFQMWHRSVYWTCKCYRNSFGSRASHQSMDSVIPIHSKDTEFVVSDTYIHVMTDDDVTSSSAPTLQKRIKTENVTFEISVSEKMLFQFGNWTSLATRGSINWVGCENECDVFKKGVASSANSTEVRKNNQKLILSCRRTLCGSNRRFLCAPLPRHIRQKEIEILGIRIDEAVLVVNIDFCYIFWVPTDYGSRWTYGIASRNE